MSRFIEWPAKTVLFCYIHMDGIDGKSIGTELQRRQEQVKDLETTFVADGILQEVETARAEYQATITQNAQDPFIGALSSEEQEKVTTFRVKPEFTLDIETLIIRSFSR